MFDAINTSIKRYTHMFLLRGSGWKHRKCRLYDQLTVQWREPETGLWYVESMAMRILLLRAQEQI